MRSWSADRWTPSRFTVRWSASPSRKGPTSSWATAPSCEQGVQAAFGGEAGMRKPPRGSALGRRSSRSPGRVCLRCRVRRSGFALDSPASTSSSSRPVLDDQVLEPPKIPWVRSHEDQVMDAGDRRDLPVRRGRRPTASTEAHAFERVPACCLPVIGKDRQGASNHLLEIRLDGSTLPRGGQPSRSEAQLVPHDRTGRELPFMFRKGLESMRVRLRLDWLGQNIRIEQVANTHRGISRPGDSSRSPSNSASPIPRRSTPRRSRT